MVVQRLSLTAYCSTNIYKLKPKELFDQNVHIFRGPRNDVCVSVSVRTHEYTHTHKICTIYR